MFLSWAAFYEGHSDAHYFNTLIPRFLDDIIRNHGVRPCEVGEFPAVQFGVNGRDFETVSEEICARKGEFHIVFVHADLGGRGLEAGIRNRREALIELARDKCGFDTSTAVMLSPKKELEAWVISDPAAIREALGVTELDQILVPRTANDAERLEDPKRALTAILDSVSVRRRSHNQVMVRIAQEQNFDALRQAGSFSNFEISLTGALKSIGIIPQD